MKKFNLILKIINTLYLSLLIAFYIVVSLEEWDGIIVYIIGFAILNLLTIWHEKPLFINTMYIIFLWFVLCIRYVYTNVYTLDITAFFVIFLQALPIATATLDYFMKRKDNQNEKED